MVEWTWSASSFNCITKNELNWNPDQILLGNQLAGSNFERYSDFANWFIHICQNNRALANAFIEDKACFFISDTVNTFVILKCFGEEVMHQILGLKKKIRIKSYCLDWHEWQWHNFWVIIINVNSRYLDILLILFYHSCNIFSTPNLKMVVFNIYGGCRMELPRNSFW